VRTTLTVGADAGAIDAVARASLRGTRLVTGAAPGASLRLDTSGEPIAALTGPLVPAAVANPTGPVVYSSWRQISDPVSGAPGQGVPTGSPVGQPSLRAIDPVTGSDTLVQAGAYSPALSTSGVLAFAKGVDPTIRQNVEHLARIEVGDPWTGRFTSWTPTPARYLPYAWAGDTLLAYRAAPDAETGDVLALRHGTARILVADATIIAVSPDATTVAVILGGRTVALVRIADGTIRASLDLEDDAARPADAADTPHAVMYAGSWMGHTIVANSDAGLVVFDVTTGIRLASINATPAFPHGVNEPAYVSGTAVIGWADTTPLPAAGNEEPGYRNALVACDLARRTCVTGAEAAPREWQRWIGNPSR